jgi:hypothetical protein
MFRAKSLKAYAALLTEASQLPDHQGGEDHEFRKRWAEFPSQAVH